MKDRLPWYFPEPGRGGMPLAADSGCIAAGNSRPGSRLSLQ